MGKIDYTTNHFVIISQFKEKSNDECLLCLKIKIYSREKNIFKKSPERTTYILKIILERANAFLRQEINPR